MGYGRGFGEFDAGRKGVLCCQFANCCLIVQQATGALFCKRENREVGASPTLSRNCNDSDRFVTLAPLVRFREGRRNPDKLPENLSAELSQETCPQCFSHCSSREGARCTAASFQRLLPDASRTALAGAFYFTRTDQNKIELPYELCHCAGNCAVRRLRNEIPACPKHQALYR